MQGVHKRESTIGFIEAIGCQLIWGFMAIFWKLVSAQSTLYCLAYRMVWAGVFVILLGVFVKKIHFLPLLKNKRALIVFTGTGLISGVNWALYIWAASSGHLLETSIGYYLSPLCTILLGLLFFKERMTPGQTIAVIMAFTGVTIFVVLNGAAIWISLMLAGTFSVYGAIKKNSGYEALPGMMIESVITGFIGALLLGLGTMIPTIWGIIPPSNDPIAIQNEWILTFLLIFSGVLTAVPLLLYSSAVNKIKFIVVGFLEYISPTMELAFAVFLFGEAFTLAHGLCLGLVWGGIIIATIETIIGMQHLKKLARKQTRHSKSATTTLQ